MDFKNPNRNDEYLTLIAGITFRNIVYLYPIGPHSILKAKAKVYKNNGQRKCNLVNLDQRIKDQHTLNLDMFTVVTTIKEKVYICFGWSFTKHKRTDEGYIDTSELKYDVLQTRASIKK